MLVPKAASCTVLFESVTCGQKGDVYLAGRVEGDCRGMGGGEKGRMKLSELASAGWLGAILNLDSRINEGETVPRRHVAGGTDLPSISPHPPPPPPPRLAKRDKVQRKFPQRGFLRNQHASTSGARSLGSKVYTELQGRGRIFWKVSQFRWGRSPTLGDDGGGVVRASLGTQWSFSWVTGEDGRRK